MAKVPVDVARRTLHRELVLSVHTARSDGRLRRGRSDQPCQAVTTVLPFTYASKWTPAVVEVLAV
jgi:hypothetical protein